ncbi:MAG: anti-sigma factor antagonist [Clostridia bacterium]|nr:anti-sigma factor antagonist [Clostridia bacterium]
MEKSRIQYSDGELIVHLYGEIDHHSVCAIRNGIDAAMYEKRPKSLVFELSDVDFMDSSGLGLILGRYAKANEIGTGIIVRNPKLRQENMLKMAHIQKILTIQHTEASQNEKKAE